MINRSVTRQRTLRPPNEIYLLEALIENSTLACDFINCQQLGCYLARARAPVSRLRKYSLKKNDRFVDLSDKNVVFFTLRNFGR